MRRRKVRARSGFFQISPAAQRSPVGGANRRLPVGYLWIWALFSAGPIGTPPSQSSIAGWRSSPKVFVPHFDRRMYQASTTPGTVEESRVSLIGILPSWFFLYQSMVASFGAVPSAFSDHTVLDFAS